MDFTREPIIESVITPKEGCKLVVRSSKGAGQEEYFVDAVEIVCFGSTFFFRSIEKPKAFLVPATDYEILEVRETRLVLKNVGLDRSIKIGGGREGAKRQEKEVSKPEISETKAEQKMEPKRKERRRHYRRRKGRESGQVVEQEGEEAHDQPVKRVQIPPPGEGRRRLEEEGIGKPVATTTSVLSSLLPPPPTLISETIERYKGNELFKNVFIPKEEQTEKSGKGVEQEPEIADEDFSSEERKVRYENPFEDELPSVEGEGESEAEPVRDSEETHQGSDPF